MEFGTHQNSWIFTCFKGPCYVTTAVVSDVSKYYIDGARGELMTRELSIEVT